MEKYYLTVVELKADEDKRATKMQYLVLDTGVSEVEKKITEHMQDSVSDWKIVSIKETKIAEVL